MTLRKRHKSLAEECPEKANLWHPTKNKPLTPKDITVGSDRKVWWFLPYDDPKTGKHFDFEWHASLKDVVSRDQGCPYLSWRAVWPGFNDLATTHPNLVSEWHPTKNGKITPFSLSAGSKEQVWWLMLYNDSRTNKQFAFEWEAPVYSRALNGNGCPYLNGTRVWKGFNDLASTFPEIAAEWNYEKNGSLTPDMVTAYASRKVWWIIHYTDPLTKRSWTLEWKACISDRTRKGASCPYLSGKAVLAGFNDLAFLRPDLATEWHPTKNGSLKPTEVSCNSGKKVWWYRHYSDPITKKEFNFEWPATIASRVSGKDCPFLSGKAVWPEYNDLLTLFPKIAAEWHPTKNRSLSTNSVTAYSEKKVWWLCPNGHSYRAIISNRTQLYSGCSECKRSSQNMHQSYPIS